MEDIEAVLISYTITTNEYKQEVRVENRNTVFVETDDIKRLEFYSAGKAGLNPQFMLKTAIIDYNGEREVEVDGKRYGIYRTYKVDKDYIELYCEEKGGLYAKQQSQTD